MGREPQPVPSIPEAGTYRPAKPLLELADWLADPVTPADFPRTDVRWRNDRWTAAVGLADLSDAQWVQHFARFEPLPNTLQQPLALRYHGHQFRVYNPEMLEALGVDTSKTFSVVETGEDLVRGDEPSPTRSAVLVRLSHGHVRIGTFQRLAVLEEREHMAALVDYCLRQFPGPLPPPDAPGRDEPAVMLLHQVVERLADLAASWMVAGFVHGVLNTDNMNVSGESFDYGPWRWLPAWDSGFTAAYFDHRGLYAFGRQPEALYWNCAQLAIALRTLTEAAPLTAALDRFGPLYMAAVRRRWLWRLGLEIRGEERDAALVAACEGAMRQSGEAPDAFFHRHRFGNAGNGELGQIFEDYRPIGAEFDGDDTPFPSMIIDEVERLWAAIAERDDWAPLMAMVGSIRRFGDRLGPALQPAGHVTGGAA